MAKLHLGDISGEFNVLTKKQTEQIIKLFDSVKKDLQKDLKGLGNTKSEKLQKFQVEDAINSLDKNIIEAYKQFEGQIDDSVKSIVDAVVQNEKGFYDSIGIKFNSSTTFIPLDVLTEIKNGKIYDQKWYLSDAIWKDQKDKLRQIHNVVAQGVAAGKTTYEIAKDLEKFVDPHAKKDWAWSKVYPGSAKKIDYNAQRLARTVIAHAYERATIRIAKNNPFSQGIMWHSALSERSCEICIERDGKVFQPDELPLDHPNGMCTYSVVTPSMEEIADRLADWVNGAEDKALDDWYAGQMSDKEAKIDTKAVKEPESSVPHYTKFVELAKKNTVEEMLELEKESLAMLTSDQRDGLRVYTGSSYRDMNRYLRLVAQGKDSSEALMEAGLESDRFKNMQDAIAGLNSTTLGKDLVLRRGTDLGDLAGFMQGDFQKNKAMLKRMSIKELNDMFVDSIGTYAGFTSTSSLYGRGFGGDVEMVLYAPKETHASSIMSISRFGTDEGETLLNAGTRVKILKIEESDGHMGSRFRVFAEILTE